MSDKQASEQVAEVVEYVVRQNGRDPGSKQPRLHQAVDTNYFFSKVMRWAKTAEQNAPPYKTDSRRRDEWLRWFFRVEPHLAGVVSSVVTIDKNRGWFLTGGRNQVNYYQALLGRAENGGGWRRYIGKQSLAFYVTDFGFATETEREGIPGRLVNLYHLDSARCRLLGGANSEISYTPSGGGVSQRWKATDRVKVGGGYVQTPADYFRGASLVSTDEAFLDLGYCAVSRCLELAQIMTALVQYDKEKLGAQAPKGILMLYNISEGQWANAMAARDAELKGKQREWFGGVATIASSSLEQADLKLIALSQLPDEFDRAMFVEFLMYGYALCFGYDSAEFWPKMRSGLSSGQEVGIQHAKATGKGGLDFALEYQTQLQNQLPDTIHYEFEQRDDQGELLAAQVNEQKAQVIEGLYTAGLKEGASLITRDEGRSLLARQGIIPAEWTDVEEPALATDTEAARLRWAREKARELPQVQNCIRYTPHEPIIRYHYPSDPFAPPTEMVLWASGHEAARPINWHVKANLKKRQNEDEILYQGDDFAITLGDALEAIDEAGDRTDPEMQELLEAEALTEQQMKRPSRFRESIANWWQSVRNK